jgi:hypothetical protein
MYSFLYGNNLLRKCYQGKKHDKNEYIIKKIGGMLKKNKKIS